MHCQVTLTAQEFTDLHNVLANLDQIQMAKVEKLVTRARMALRGAYQQEHDDVIRRSSHYDKIREELGLSTTWSIHTVDDLNDVHAYPGATQVAYKDQWGEKFVIKPITGDTWASLYQAANEAIMASGNSRHDLIKDFRRSNVDSMVLELSVGS